MKTVITSSSAPAALGPYSQAIRCGNMLFLSGQLGLDPETGDFPALTAGAQAKQALANLQAVLKEAGASVENVVKTTVFLADMADFVAVNSEYEKVFSSNPPARSCVAVAKLPKSGLVEIECIAVLEK